MGIYHIKIIFLVAYTSVQAYAYDGEIWHEIIEIPSLSKHT